MSDWTIFRVEEPDPAVEALLERHQADMQAQTPEESCHVMTGADLRAVGAMLHALRGPNGDVLAIGALKPLGDHRVELKSMHTSKVARGRGVGRRVLAHLLEEARNLGACEVLLETGSGPDFSAARGLYKRAGFVECAPFADYVEDPLSVFLSLRL